MIGHTILVGRKLKGGGWDIKGLSTATANDTVVSAEGCPVSERRFPCPLCGQSHLTADQNGWLATICPEENKEVTNGE